MWPRLDECEKYCESGEAAQLGDAVKVQTQREEELAEGKRRLEVRPKQPPNLFCRTDELTHVAQSDGDPRQSHQKISAEQRPV